MANVEVVDVDSCKKNLIIEIPAEVTQQEFDRISREFAKHARVSGFRPGKIPVSIVKRRFREEIKRHLIEDLVPRYYREALDEKQLKPVAEPHLENVDFVEGGPLKFQATVEVLPPVKLEGYQDLRSTVTKPAVGGEEVQKALESLQERHAKFMPVEDRASKLGDYVVVNLKGRVADGSGVEFQDKNVNIHLGNADNLAEFTENLTGLTPGSNRTFSIEYPADFRNSRLAGKKVEYDAEVVAVKEKRLPPLDDDLAIEAGDYSNLEQLREAVKQSLEEAANQEYESNVREDLLRQVISRNQFDIPETLVENELRRVFQRIAEQMARGGIDIERANIDWKAIAEENRPKAAERARWNVALTTIADQESLEVTDQELEAEIKRLAELGHKTSEAVRAGLAKEGRLEDLRSQLRRQRALDWLRSHAA